MKGQVPEKVLKLYDKQGNLRIQLVAQIWLLQDQAYVTSAALGVMAPHEFTDEDCAWLAEKFKELLRKE